MIAKTASTELYSASVCGLDHADKESSLVESYDQKITKVLYSARLTEPAVCGCRELLTLPRNNDI